MPYSVKIRVKIPIAADNRRTAAMKPLHSLGEADLWLAPHRGSEATGVVYKTPPTNSLGEADSHSLNLRTITGSTT